MHEGEVVGPFSAAAGVQTARLPECPEQINGVPIPPDSPLRELWRQLHTPVDADWTPEQMLVDRRLKIEAAKVLAGFLHPKLAQVEHRGSVTISHEDALKALE